MTRSAQPSKSDDRARPRLTDHKFLQLRLLVRHLRTEARFVGDGTVLDIGCGAKPYADLFDGPCLGLDLRSVNGRPDCVARAESLPVASQSVDAVLSTQQLEHVDSPLAVLTEARRVLRDGGRLLLSTHGVWPYHPDPHDLWRWTEEGLIRLVADAGFTVEKVHHQGELLATSIALAIYPLGGARRSSRPIRAMARSILVLANVIGLAVDGLAARVFPRHYASLSYLIVARAAPRQ